MAMDAVLATALKAGAGKPVHLVTVTLPAYTIRWSDGGFLMWGGQPYAQRDATYGTLESIGKIADGVGDDAEPVQIGILAPSLTSLAGLSAADAQGGVVTIHLGCLDRDTGLLIGEPYRLHRGQLDRPVISVRGRKLTYEILTAEALCLEPNEEQRQSHAFHQAVWPGEKGYEHQTDGTKIVFWRDDDPNNAIGYVSRRKKKGGDPKEFNYDTDAGWPFPAGRTNIKGTLNYRVGYGPTNRYNSIMATLAASGPIQGIVSVEVNDELTSFGTNDVATNGEHAGALWVQRKLGAQPQSATTFPTGLDYAGQPPAGWDNAYGQSGKAVFLATLFENSKKDEYQGGVPTFQFVVDGLKGWDPRLDSSVGGSGACRLNDPTTWVMMQTGPIWDLNWCIGRWEGDSGGGKYGVPYACSKVGGLGAALDDIDVAAFVAAANVADANTWKVSDVPTSADDKHEVRKRILASAAVEPSRKCGQISCVSYGAARASLMTVSNADTAGDFDISTYASRLERRNYAIPRFTSPAHRWELTAIAPITNPAWVTADGGRRSNGPSYPTIPAATQAAQICYLDLANDREMAAETPFKPHMLQLEPGDCFTWQEPEFLLVGVKAQVRKRSYDPSTTSVRIEWRRETDAKYAEAMAQVGVAPATSVANTPPTAVLAEPNTISVSPSGANVNLQARAPLDTRMAGGSIRIYARPNNTAFGGATLIATKAAASNAFVTHTHTPGASGAWSYWFVSLGSGGEVSDPAGPITVTI